MIGIGGINHLVLAVEHDESHASGAFHGKEGVGLQVGVARWLRPSRQVAGELSEFAALSHGL